MPAPESIAYGWELSAAHISHIRLANAYIERFDWATSIDRCDRPYALFYLDPPYFETEGYGVAFPFAEYEKIAERLRSIKGAGDRQPQ
ncbi:hypothetical protein J3L14_08085 [Burkholderia pseudomallei]|uniref:Gp27 n=1 Tax=Burkholderia mallei (strain NCTC 10229) TaxID=412022 RepID=D0IUR1_BURM9|nr:gp27 [Burkholderia mallei SAVP1]ABO05947.2 conserved hypothetical protein [Burkholderia mallei NCTC 10247]ACX94492.1 conserved hypothetical protein [Burkholderia mallei NCTC 10229]AIO64754.1 putative gp27 [Burkholderia mallei]AIV63633.1 putative gp27 [Burkholderia pseudomallei K42]ARK50528.1 hypothetical protein BOC35_31585 [Burkholderia pseudomallei]EEC35111.1 conserved domain protein [Burkholderia pseudomallei 576]EEP86523.1 conserved hypothetical protein [Burkholderia mallei GB8 horse 